MQISTVNSLMGGCQRWCTVCRERPGFPGVNALRFGDATAVMSTCVARPVAFSSLITAPTKRIRHGILNLRVCSVPDAAFNLDSRRRCFRRITRWERRDGGSRM